jgi:hypothetical protein
MYYGALALKYFTRPGLETVVLHVIVNQLFFFCFLKLFSTHKFNYSILEFSSKWWGYELCFRK